jgi:hypothetical protein
MVEQAVADPNSGALADAPSSLVVFNNAGLVLAAIGLNLNRAAGPVASLFQAKATTAVSATTGEAAVGDSGIKAILGWLGHRRRLGPAMLDASIAGQSVRSCWPTSPELLFADMGRQPGEEVHRQGRGLWMGGEARGPDVPQGGGTWLNW